MNIDVSSELFEAQFVDATDLLRSFSQSNNLNIDAAISIMMAAASREGGFDAIIAMQKASAAILIDCGQVYSQSRQQRRWASKQSNKANSADTVRKAFPEIFTFNPIVISDPED